MPFRSKATLEEWLEEFRAAGHSVPGTVAPQDGVDGRDTGLIVLRLTGAGTYVYMQPVAPHDPRWQITFEARENEVAMSPNEVRDMGIELQAVSALCEYLQAQSVAYIDAHR